MIELIGGYDIYVGGVYELQKCVRPICAHATWRRYIHLGSCIVFFTGSCGIRVR